MRAKTLQVVWHSREPVYSVDFHPDGTLATGGGDKEIKVRGGTVGSGDLNGVTGTDQREVDLCVQGAYVRLILAA